MADINPLLSGALVLLFSLGFWAFCYGYYLAFHRESHYGRPVTNAGAVLLTLTSLATMWAANV